MQYSMSIQTQTFRSTIVCRYIIQSAQSVTMYIRSTELHCIHEYTRVEAMRYKRLY